MGLFLRILIGLVIAAIGAYMVIKTRKMLEFFGPIPWADAHLGGGGTNLMYKLIGIVAIFIGFMVATNLWNAFMQATLGSMFGANK
jgi:hypothetical protein